MFSVFNTEMAYNKKIFYVNLVNNCLKELVLFPSGCCLSLEDCIAVDSVPCLYFLWDFIFSYCINRHNKTKIHVKLGSPCVHVYICEVVWFPLKWR